MIFQSAQVLLSVHDRVLAKIERKNLVFMADISSKFENICRINLKILSASPATNSRWTLASYNFLTLKQIVSYPSNARPPWEGSIDDNQYYIDESFLVAAFTELSRRTSGRGDYLCV